MIVNTGIRRFLGSAIQRLFNSASFYAPLTHTLALERGTGSPTFTRASTATVTNNDGYLVTALSGEARFEGARRIYNLCPTPSTSIAVSGNKTITVTPGVYVFSMGAEATGTCLITFTGTATGSTGTLTASASARTSSVLTITVGGTIIATCTVQAAADVQFEDVTAQTTQTAGPYISVGAYDDWIGTDAISNGTFDTVTTGWTAVNSTLSIESGKLRVTNVGANAGYCHQAITTVVGTKYVLRADITQQTSSAYSIYIGNGPGSGALGGLGTNASVEFTATATTTYISPINTQAVDGRYTDFDNISVKPAIYHGSMVDGVKCFPTDLAGNALTTMLGYQAEGARTNLCLQSNSLNTVPWTDNSGTATVTQNAIGPDGVVSAWTITDDSGVSAEGRYASLVLTAATYTYSVFVKKETGAPTNYPVIAAFEPGGGLTTAVVTIDTVNGLANAWTAYSGRVMAPGLTGRCTSFNSAFWRVEMSFTATAADWGIRLLPAGSAVSTALNTAIDGAVQGSAVFYGAQVELGSSASSYIATTTVAVTRNADVEAVSTSGNIAAAAGSVYLEYTPTHSPSGTIAFWGTYVDASNYTAILHDATNLIFRKRIAGSNYDATIANAFSSGTTYKVAATWGAAGTAIYLDGVAGTPHANTTAAQIAATMQVGADGNSLQQPGAGTTNLRIWQRQLSAPEGVAVTS